MSLDIDHEIERHCFWPVDEKVLVSFQGYDTKLVNEPIDMFETEKDEFVKFQMVNDYIRNTYHYCIWCGCKYDSAQELKLECPGNTRKDHDE
jgi:hypothetical protein